MIQEYMNQKNKYVIILIFLIILFFAINYPFLDSLLVDFLDEGETFFVKRVIDGDTIVIDEDISVRLLGINSPERGEVYYNEAKEFLENLVLNKTVKLKYGKDKYDKYHRVLAYVFVGNKNVNLELVKDGLANYYFPAGKDTYYNEFKSEWENCIESDKNLCEKSKDECASCIGLKEFDYGSDEIIFHNSCDFNCELTGWKIKDEGRKNFIFPKFILESRNEVKINVGNGINTKSNLFWKDEDYVWTNSGDTLFLSDKEGGLVLWESY